MTIKKDFLLTLASVGLILCTISGFGQRNTLTDSLLNQVRLHYNLQQPEKIYKNTSAEFHKKMTQFQFQEGMAKFYAKTGQWNSITFKGQTDKGSDYLCSFDKSDQIVSIKLDQDGKINRLNFAQVATQIPAKQEQVASNNPLKDSIDLHVERLVRPYIQKGNTCGITIAIIDRGNIYRYSYGSVNKLKEQLPDPELTIFEIGSVTKTFNALLLAKAVTAGKMKLEDPVNRYLPTDIPQLAFQGNPLKLIHLANHTSGLPRLPCARLRRARQTSIAMGPWSFKGIRRNQIHAERYDQICAGPAWQQEPLRKGYRNQSSNHLCRRNPRYGVRLED